MPRCSNVLTGGHRVSVTPWREGAGRHPVSARSLRSRDLTAGGLRSGIETDRRRTRTRPHPFGAQHAGGLRARPRYLPGHHPGGQTDDGSGFRSVFVELSSRSAAWPCRSSSSHAVPNRSTERCRRTGRKELHETSSVAATLDEYRRDARRIAVHHKHVRPHAAPGGRSPSGVYANTLERASFAT